MKPQIMKYWLGAALLTLSAVSLQAQDYSIRSTSLNDSLDVPSHLFPSIYRESSVDVFDSVHWYNNTSLLFDWSPQLVISSRTSHERLNGFGFSLMKEFTPEHALLVRGSFDTYSKYVGLGLGYMLNLTNYYWGYDRMRRNTWSLSTGLEGGLQNKENLYMGGFVGLHFDHAISPYSSLFFEPRLGVYGQYYATSLAAGESDDPVISAISAQIGYRFRLSEHTTIMPELKSMGNNHDRNWFLEMGGTMHEQHIFEHVKRERQGIWTDKNGNTQTGGTEEVTQDTLTFGGGISVGLGYKGNKYSAALVRGELSSIYNNMHLTAAVDYLFSFTNAYLGENLQRHTDMDFLIGPVFMFNNLNKDKMQFSLGLEWGARLYRHITPEWELYVEPKWNFVKCYSEGVNGLRYINFQPSMGFAYTYQHRGFIQSTHQKPMDGWYVQSLLGMQLATFDSEGGKHQLGDMEFSIGRDMTALWGGRIGVFAGSMKNAEKDPVKDSYTDIEYPMFSSYYGVRGEVVINFLRMWSPSLEDSRWNWSLSTGLEYGKVSNVHRNQFAFVAGSQLQYRTSSHTWLTMGGRYHAVTAGEAIKPMEGLIGVQYDFSMPRTFDYDPVPFHFYVLGGGTFRNAFFNMDEVGYNASVGADFKHVHGVRLNILSTKDHRTLLGADYVYNFTAAMMGQNVNRRADMSMLAGVVMDMDLMSNGKEGIGLGLGIEADYHLKKNISLFLQPRLNYMPWDKQCQDIVNERLSMYSLFGVRLDFGK